MEKKSTTEKVLSALELAHQAIVSARKFLDSDTPAANATKTLLAVVALAPIALVGAMAPNVFIALKPFMKKREFTRREVSYALQSLDRSKYLSIHYPMRGQTEIRITKKGMRQVRRLSLETVKLPSPTTWNGKWHLLFYDIPVKYNSARMALRDIVDDLGMYPLQKSLWVYPHNCEAEILFISRFFGVEDCVNFAVADALLDEEELLKFFNLKKL